MPFIKKYDIIKQLLESQMFDIYDILKVTVVIVMNVTKFLSHITTEENGQKIKDENKFIPSVHTNNSIQWLGNGVYFWDSNDDRSIKVGYHLVKNKKGNTEKKVQRIRMLVSTDEENYMDLDDEIWQQHFDDFLKKFYPGGNELLEMLEMLKKQKWVRTKDLNKVGKAFGTAMNVFIEVLNSKEIRIDMVSHYFFHKRIFNALYSRNELFIRQFCVKNTDIVNCIDSQNWIIDYII